ncbi:Heme oxygenase (HemO) (PDB:1J77) [Commensalibacter communis]|uniref:biliverdin-producing heme oxygenase n=1 Tax=Commensalibacter communis TaxID=2972786 RepID=UPI0022FFB18A|nr:biliverdin-producing heme oxygenase [Commensalibacter communis]CAI3949747.1 Heme oxygenase (HemO) (PDB:1J77) [Commensalibacter communis]
MSELQEPLLTSTLRNRTKSVHGKLDEHLMGLGLFSDKEKYKQFLTIQYYIHLDADHLYSNSQLAAMIPNLKLRNRFNKLKEDMADLNVPTPAPIHTPVITNTSSAIGTLYVVEGSKLGAKYLLHSVGTIGLSDQYGARHLGADDEGRGVSWRSFQAAIDTAPIDISVAVHAAEQAFNRVFTHVHNVTG